FSHVDIVVEDLHAFLSTWCPRLGFVASEVQTWGSPEEPTWTEYAFVFGPNGQLIFMAVEGKKGVHVELLRKYGSGSIYRLCFKTDNLEACFGHLEAAGTKATDLEGVPFNSFQDVMNSGKRILWLEREGELSMEILTAPIIDAGCEKLKREVGFESNQLSAWQRGLCAAAALGAAFIVGVFCGRETEVMKKCVAELMQRFA
ncbi:unnamed protein product, partial [Symbiodinium sp. KB8]